MTLTEASEMSLSAKIIFWIFVAACMCIIFWACTSDADTQYTPDLTRPHISNSR